ncbi:hypothetical protein DXF96_00110 [Heyndrickxia coagulans]|uniref:hypothetical protein n=1 Tax=Heyndrickxia coagulans TaxID=1398 RepID=UPI000D73974B|nr:hypothetical protein [Heyndrickxia coagulans]AWP37764.1 hypothetical protein CYJ15_12620 [Heyndrickxia coagulans]QDI60077.1 hypothetical protein DXF96_00110 [Heyndrickxia coagulans]
MALLGSVDIPFTKSTQIANGAQQTATQAADTAGQAQTTAQTASQTATQAANTAENAAQAAQIAITTANGKNKAYYGAATPTSPQSGDIWFVEDSSGNVTAIKHYDGAQWVTDVDNAELAQQISAAQAAADNAAAVGQEAQQAANTAQQAATQAKTDAANAVTQANNAVDKANDAAANAQSAIDKAQEGFDAAQDALSKAGNATDIANTAKQVASDAATAADTAKANAQTALTNAQDAIDKANAANANANTREKSIVKSNTAPSNPEKDQLWVDTSKTPQIMRRWNGTAWVDLSPTQASQIGAVSTTTYTTDITNINNTLSQKASATTVNTLTGRVDKAETAISQNANAIASKADKSYVDTLKNTVDSHSTLISQNADAIALKASQSTVDALTGRVSTAEATLKTQADQIAARITKTDADAKYATQASLTATANSLTSNISAVQTNLDNLQVGGRNLVPNSTGLLLNSDGKTAQSWQEGTISHANNDGTNSLEVQNSRTSETTRAGTAFSVEPNTTYIFRARIKGSTNSTTMDVYFLGSKTTKTGIGGSFDYVHLLATGTTNKDNFQEYITTFTTSSDEVCGYIRIDNNASSDGNISSVYFSQIKLEKGNKATDWTPAPEDMATQSQISQLSNNINLRVSKNDVINQINLSTESILIGGNKVHITGQTTIDNAVIKDAMIASMTANKLTAGTIDANAITVKNINASNITTGTLNAARIAAGSIDASKLSVSSLSAISANLGTVTAGTLSGVQINGSNFYQSANNIQTWLDGNGFHQQYNGGQLDTWINSDGINVFNWGNLKFGIDNNGNVVANNIKLNGDMALNGTFNIPTTLTGRDGGAGLHGRYQYTESLSSYNPKILDGDWFLNSSFLGFRTKATVQTTNTTYFGTSYYGATAMKLRAYVNSSNGQYDGDYTNLNNRVDIMPSQITMGQYQPSGSSNWPDEIKIRADGTIYASKSIQSGNVYFNGANSIKNDSSILYLEGNGGIQSNNILINGAHSIKSLDGGEIYLNNSGTGYVDLTVKTLHQASRWELKENFETMDPEIALKNIINTDVVRYNFKGESEIHVGLVIDDRDNPEYRACSDFITPDRKSKKDETIVGELMLATKALNAYTNDHKERLSVLEEQNKNLILKVANLEMELANIKQKLGVA